LSWPWILWWVKQRSTRSGSYYRWLTTGMHMVEKHSMLNGEKLLALIW
jgi:hypothetical protein